MNATRDSVGSPGTRSARPDPVTPLRSAPLYRQPGICVTYHWFIVGRRRFPVSELTHLRTARGPRDPLSQRAMVVTGTVLGSVGATLGFTRGMNQVTPAAVLALAAAAFVPLLLAAFGHRMRPRAFELWGEYRGLTMLLFTCDDERQYGQVTRALLRAQEVNRLGGVAEPVSTRTPWIR